MGSTYHPVTRLSLHSLTHSQAKLIDDDEQHAGESTTIEIQPKLEKNPSIKKSDSPVKKGTKRGPQETKKPSKKRQKKEETPSGGEISEAPTEDSVISDFKDSEDSDSPKIKKKDKAKPRARAKTQSRKRAKAESDESEIDDISEPSIVDSDDDSDASSDARPRPSKKPKKEHGKRSRPSKSKVESDEESEDEHVSFKTSPPKAKTERGISSKLESEDEKSTIQVGYVDSDSEAAMMIDADSKPKRKKKVKSEASSSSKAPRPKAAAPKDLSPDEAHIKTLQSQLIKCGVRKIWGIVLKKFGDDNKQKIRFLQDMLKDVGMTGRFSDQRAKEIKELRELQADLEAVQQGNSIWGEQSSGTRARGQRKSLREPTLESGDEDGDNDDGGFEGDRTEDKAARVKQELAFLGDEESDSD